MASAQVQPGELNLALYKGDSFYLPMSFDGVEMAGTWRAQMRLRAASADEVIATFTVVVAGSTVTISLPAATTAGLTSTAVWDLEQTAPDGTVRTWLRGSVTINWDVTR